MGELRAKLQKQLYDDMNASKRLMMPYFTYVVSAHNISPAQAHILSTVNDNHPISLKALAGKTMLTPGAITQLVDPLVRQALVTRTPDQKDRRITNITITPKGLQIIESIHKYRDELMSQSVTTLTDAELEQLVAIQRKMTAQLKAFIEIATAKKEKA
ncbi:MAG TPA: MarR family transcriptional regulator [Candidatus Saccharimonadales bacterium]|nr:MarR family transcriptional regulator [Candidatus Saccharimonadales bacterium]